MTSSVHSSTHTNPPQQPNQTSTPTHSASSSSSSIPKGIILGPDGKPCKVCTGFKAWTSTQATKIRSGDTIPASSSTSTAPAPATATAATATVIGVVTTGAVERDASGLRTDCPPDGDRLGQHTWTFLHTTAAHYPTTPDARTQRSVRALLDALAVLYPCQPCAGHLQAEIARNPPDVSSRERLERWMCETHNEVNRRLGKDEFDCTLVAQRWRDGWSDGRCDD